MKLIAVVYLNFTDCELKVTVHQSPKHPLAASQLDPALKCSFFAVGFLSPLGSPDYIQSTDITPDSQDP